MTTAFDLAARFVGVKEVPGKGDNPFILGMLRLDSEWPQHDEVPWCSAFMNFVAWMLRLPRSKSLLARSWLDVGLPVANPIPGWDVVIFWRGYKDDGRTGHVGFYAGTDESGNILVLGGNQGNMVSIAPYDRTKVLGYRRLKW